MPFGAGSLGAFFDSDEGREFIEGAKFYEQQQQMGEYANARSAVNQLSDDRKTLKGDRRSSLLAQMTSEGRLRHRAGVERSGAVANAGGTAPADFRGALDNQLRRTKMRTRMQNMGEDQVGQQSLKDRIAVAQSSRGREFELINAFGKSAQIRQGVNLANADANQALKEGRFGAAGTILGAGLSAYLNGAFGNLFGGGKNTTGGVGAGTGGYGK